MTRSDHQQCEERNKAISDHHAALASLHKAAAEHHRKMGAAGTGGAVSGGAGAVRPPGSQYGESNFFESAHAGGDFYKNLGTNPDEAERAGGLVRNH
jgi:hypothetical protein